MAPADRSVPSRALTRVGRTVTSSGPGTSPTTSMTPSASLNAGPAVRASNSQNRSAARSMPAGSQPRSNLAEASVRRLSRLDVRAMAMGTK